MLVQSGVRVDGLLAVASRPLATLEWLVNEVVVPVSGT
jgi:hypothetical protein